MQSADAQRSKVATWFFVDKRSAWMWLLVRLYVGWQWFEAGWAKLQSPDWVGSTAGTVIHGFFLGALKKTTGTHPDVSLWYGWFIQHVALPHEIFFSYLVACGEVAVGIGLIVGLCTGWAAFFGMFMNLNYLWAGTVSLNPTLLILQLFLLLAWRTAGWVGLDRWALPWFAASRSIGSNSRRPDIGQDAKRARKA